MRYVVFVGDKPSKKNVSSFIPFIGAGCFKKLVKWIKFLEPDYYLCFNSHNIYSLSLANVKILSRNGFKVIALGEEASKRLNMLAVNHFKLPHPSGLNRKLNNKKYVEKQLEECKKWLNS